MPRACRRAGRHEYPTALHCRGGCCATTTPRTLPKPSRSVDRRHAAVSLLPGRQAGTQRRPRSAPGAVSVVVAQNHHLLGPTVAPAHRLPRPRQLRLMARPTRTGPAAARGPHRNEPDTHPAHAGRSREHDPTREQPQTRHRRDSATICPCSTGQDSSTRHAQDDPCSTAEPPSATPSPPTPTGSNPEPNA